MTQPAKALFTPIRIKDRPELTYPPEEKASYVLARNGLFLRRTHSFFTSCVAARDWPQELFAERPSFEARFPKVRRVLLERIVGFFDAVRDRDGAEAAVLLAWDPGHEQIVPLVPEQTATMGRSWGKRTYPIGLEYDRTVDLPPGGFVFGDVHSHVDAAAYASGTDKHDESYLAGLHIVVGRLYHEPPEFHVEAVVDGMRFPLAFDDVAGGYRERRPDFPPEWLDRVEVREEEPWKPKGGTSYGSAGGYSGYGSASYASSCYGAPTYETRYRSSYSSGSSCGGGNGRAVDRDEDGDGDGGVE